MTKQTKFIIYLLTVSLIILYLSFQMTMYRGWVKNATIDSFEACMTFERVREGEEYCINHARDNSGYSPYPFWKALILINP